MNSAFKILLAIVYAWNFGLGLYTPLFAIFAQRIGADIFTLSSIYAGYWLTAGILNIVLGHFIERFEKENIMAIGFLITAVTCFFMIFINNPIELLISEISLGIGTSLIAPTWDALFVAFISQRHSIEESGYYEGGVRLILALASFLGGAIVSCLNFAALFLIIGITESFCAGIIVIAKPLDMTYFHWKSKKSIP